MLQVVAKMIEYKTKIFDLASKNTKKAQERMKQDYDCKRNPPNVSYDRSI